jgi:CRISPR-associated protein Cas2
MRRCYLVTYDICNQKRWRKVFRIMNGHGEWWQYSVFFCILKEIDRVRMQTQLEECMNLKEDKCLIIDLGANEETARETMTALGASLPKGESGMMVV